MGLSKDADMSPFEAGRKLLALDSAKLTLNDRIDLVFQDADLVPLLVQVASHFNRLSCLVVAVRPVLVTDFCVHYSSRWHTH